MTENIYPAYIAALAELANPVKDAKADTGRFSYTYATLPTILDIARPVLAKHGLALTQNVSTEDGRLRVWTTIMHTSGEEITFGPITGTSGGDWQALGSAITYCRRYGMSAALGIAAEDDDDAQATKKPEKHVEKPIERVKATTPATDDPWLTPIDPETGEAAELVLKELGGEVITTSEHPMRGADMHTNHPASEKQIAWVKKLVTRHAGELGVDEFEFLNASLDDIGFPQVTGWDVLGKAAASQLIERLK
jgi:hypothetical protein